MRRVATGQSEGAIRVQMSQAERELLLHLLMLTPEIEARLTRAPDGNGTVEVLLRPDDVQELAGFVAFEALHTGNRKLEAELNRLFDRLEDLMR